MEHFIFFGCHLKIINLGSALLDGNIFSNQFSFTDGGHRIINAYVCNHGLFIENVSHDLYTLGDIFIKILLRTKYLNNIHYENDLDGKKDRQYEESREKLVSSMGSNIVCIGYFIAELKSNNVDRQLTAAKRLESFLKGETDSTIYGPAIPH